MLVLTLAIVSGGDSIPGHEATMFSSSGDPDALFASLSFPSHWGHSQAVCPELELEPEISATWHCIWLDYMALVPLSALSEP